MKKIISSLIILIILSIGGYFFIQQKPLRYAVFAGYNADGKIPDYVITYLKGLKEVADGIVYITDSPLLPEEEKKVSPYIMHGEYIRHEEYDFGSYKRGYNWLKENGYLQKADELIFANDSTFAPLTSFKQMFSDMAKRPELDFWGDSQNSAVTPHLQSYFLVFRKKVINSKNFYIFMQSIRHQEASFMYIMEYEIKLTPTLERSLYKWDSWIPYKELNYLELTDKNSYPYTLISDYGHQFLKRSTFTNRLEIREDRGKLLRYLNKNYPKTYNDIMENLPQSEFFLH